MCESGDGAVPERFVGWLSRKIANHAGEIVEVDSSLLEDANMVEEELNFQKKDRQVIEERITR